MYVDPSGEFAEPITWLVVAAYIAVGVSAAVGAYALIKNYFGDYGSTLVTIPKWPRVCHGSHGVLVILMMVVA